MRAVRGLHFGAALVITIVAGAPHASPPKAATGSGGREVPDALPFLGSATIGCAYLTCSSGAYHPWPAVDFRLPLGTPVRATAPGTVALVDEEVDGEGDPDGCATETSYCGAPGLFIAIEHRDGPYSVYKHLLASHVDVGDVVERGQVIGQVGSAQASRAHLHYDEQATLVDLNRPGSRLPLGPMYYWSGGRRRAPGSIGGATDWSGLPRGTRITSTAWRTGRPLSVSTPRQFRLALAGLGAADTVGPFVIRLEADITLSGGPLEYRGDDLLIVLGRRFSLRRDNGCRVIETIGPLELNHVGLGPAQGGCAPVSSTRLVTVVGHGIRPSQLDAAGGAAYVSA